MHSIRTLKLGLVAASLIVLVCPAITPAAPAERHSGVVTAVNAKTGTLTVEELGANAVRRQLLVHVAPQARVVLSERKDKVPEVQDIFAESPITLADVKAGDFVVVEVTGAGKTSTANSVIVTHRR